MTSSIKCPRCGLLNPIEAEECDCGQDLITRYDEPRLPAIAPASSTQEIPRLEAEQIVALAGILAPEIINWLHKNAKEVVQEIEKDKELPSDARLEVFRQSFLFGLHILDRAAFAKFGAFQRQLFIDPILQAVADQMDASGIPQSDFATLWNGLQREWQSYPLIPPEGNSRRRVIFPRKDGPGITVRELSNSEGPPLSGTVCAEWAKAVAFTHEYFNLAGVYLICHRFIGLFIVFSKTIDGLIQEKNQQP